MVVPFALATAIWSSTWLVITFQLGRVAPEVSVCYRFALAAAVLGAWCAWRGRSMRFAWPVHAWLLAQGALFFGLNYVAVYKAEQYIASGLVAVIFSMVVFTTMVATRIAFGTHITARAIAGASLGVGGVALLFLPSLREVHDTRDLVLGAGYAVASTVLATGGTLVSMRLQRRALPILPTTAWGMAYGALIAAVVTTAAGSTWSFDTSAAYVLSLAYLAIVGSVVAFAAYLTVLARAGPGPSSYIGVATPALAMVLSTIFEGYRWNAVGIAGMALALAGNVLALRRPEHVARAPLTRAAAGPRR